jgi:hypothetical protein
MATRRSATDIKRELALLRETAHHEAGHAVASVYCGWHFRHVTIRSNKRKRYEGYIHYDRRPIFEFLVYMRVYGVADYNFHAGLIAKPETAHLAKPCAKVVEQDLIILLAGGLAEKSFTLRNPILDWRDKFEFGDLIVQAGGEGPSADAYRYRVRRKARDFVDSHWREIKRVAAALLKRKTLTFEEVEALCSQKRLRAEGAA